MSIRIVDKVEYGLDKKKRRFIVNILKEFHSPLCFEWGCGLSTNYFLKHCSHINKWISIENDLDWFTYLSQNIKFNNLTIRCVPASVSRTKEEWWELENSNPRDVGRYFLDYVNSIREYSPNFILIDGRARLQCMEAAVECVHKKGCIVMDDSHRVSRNLQEWHVLNQLKRQTFDKRLHVFRCK